MHSLNDCNIFAYVCKNNPVFSVNVDIVVLSWHHQE